MSDKVTKREILAGEKSLLDSLNDTDRARDAAESLRDDLMFVPGLGWHSWDGKRWLEVSDDEALGIVQAWHWSFSNEQLMNLPTKDLAAFLSIGSVRATVAGLKPLLLVRAEQLDAEPDVLNVANGIVDLRTGELGRHDPARRMTKLAPVDYKPGAEHPDWKAALKALPKQQRERIRFKLGQAATGHQPDDDVVMFWLGVGANGKSTVLDAARETLGDYAVMVPARLLVGNLNDHPTELTTLKGVRLATAEELTEGHRLNVTVLKTLAGTAVITARRVHRDNISFRPSHSLVVNSNYNPAVTETDDGTWRRLEPIRFPYQYVGKPEHDRQRKSDRNLRDRLRKGRAGRAEAVLAWLVSGARDWYAAGMSTPDAPERIEADKRAWRHESDIILRFIDDCLVVVADEFTPATELYEVFRKWMDTQGQQVPSQRVFNERLVDHGELAGKVRRGMARVGGRPTKGWHGLVLGDFAQDDIRYARALAGFPYPSTTTTD
ncbi:DNA primase family protein [Microbacterium oxydans]|uniref:DNA primase family protein n=1 Tax=Microbacterium oxydans TaxID=82380 RepID=UPI000F8FAE40|nr:phage/plasmid primase, P4 family [Microbacterium oxydans]AZS48177.1 hypothetical protein CVS53_02893 [Microbacterium oxydans]